MPELPRIDFSSDAWLQIAAWAGAQLEQARVRNDAALSHDDTQSLRGEIKFAKKLLGLPQAVALAQQAESADSPFGGPGH